MPSMPCPTAAISPCGRKEPRTPPRSEWRFETMASACHRKSSPICLSHFSLPRNMGAVLAWASPSAETLWNDTEEKLKLRLNQGAVPLSRSPCPCSPKSFRRRIPFRLRDKEGRYDPESQFVGC